MTTGNKPPRAARPGCFITLEGIDGAGKSTHAAWLTHTLKAHGLEVIHTREPGGTAVGEHLRELLLNTSMQADTELMLMFAARNEHVQTVILPNLEQGVWVVCDRFTDATYAYQGGGRQMPLSRISLLEDVVHPSLQPDCTFLFDIDIPTARQRLRQHGAPDRFEAEQQAFFERTRHGYLMRARQYADRFRVLDAAQSVETIQADLARHLQVLLTQHAAHQPDPSR